jgi:VanZ family protein
VWLQIALIFVLSSIPYVSALPGGMSDKTGHFIGYGILGALTLRALARERIAGVTLRAALLAVLLSAAYGVSDECHQYFVPGRSPDVYDVAADTAGAAAAAVGLWAILKIASLLRDHDV